MPLSFLNRSILLWVWQIVQSALLSHKVAAFRLNIQLQVWKIALVVSMTGWKMYA